MPILSEAMSNEPIRLLVYSDTGGGKTTLWGRMAKYEQFYPIYCFDFDLRLASLRATLSQEELARIYFDSYRDDKIQGASFTAAQRFVNNPQALFDQYKVQFKTLVVDSGTYFGKAMMAQILKLNGNKPADFKPSWDEYHAHLSKSEEFVGKLIGTGLNIVVTTQELTDKDESSGRLFKSIDWIGDVARRRLPGYFNELWHAEVVSQAGKPTVFAMRTRKDGIVSARTTFGFLENVEPQATIWDKILNNGKA